MIYVSKFSFFPHFGKCTKSNKAYTQSESKLKWCNWELMNTIAQVIRTFCMKTFNPICSNLALLMMLVHAVQQFRVSSFIIAFSRVFLLFPFLVFLKHLCFQDKWNKLLALTSNANRNDEACMLGHRASLLLR